MCLSSGPHHHAPKVPYGYVDWTGLAWLLETGIGWDRTGLGWEFGNGTLG